MYRKFPLCGKLYIGYRREQEKSTSYCKIAIESDVCDALFEALEECSNVEKKSSCSEGTWNLSNATRSYYKVASQKPGFKSKEYDNLCSQACSTGRWMGKSAFKKSFCDVN